MADETHRLIYADTAYYMLLEGYDIRDVPTAADVQPVKRGKWKWDEKPIFGNPYGSYICSECGAQADYKENYCCECGADMRGEDNG